MPGNKECLCPGLEEINTNGRFYFPDQETVLFRTSSGKLLVPYVSEPQKAIPSNPGSICALRHMLPGAEKGIATIGDFACFNCQRFTALRGLIDLEIQNLNLDEMTIIDIE